MSDDGSGPTLLSGQVRDDDLIHDLADRLNGIGISIELAVRVLQQPDNEKNPDIVRILSRARDDCVACNDLLAKLRASPLAANRR